MILNITEISNENHASRVVKNGKSRITPLGQISPHAANLGPITNHAVNLGPITRRG